MSKYQVEVYDLRYAQSHRYGRYALGCEAISGPSIGTLWSRREADAVAAMSDDLVVVPVMMDESLALSVAE